MNIKKHHSKNIGFSLNRKQMLYIVLFFSIALYAITTTFDFTLDDTLMISSNELTKKGISGIPDIFTNDAFVGFFGQNKELVAGGRYRPLTHAMFAVEYELFSANPLVGHIINVFLYAILAIVIFHTLELCFRNFQQTHSWIQYIPFTATLLFIAHPLHTEVVANIKGRDEIISMGGSMLALLYSLKYVEKKKYKFLFFSFIAMLVGIFSKENAITFLAVIPLTLFFFSKAKLKDYFVTLIPISIASLSFILARINALGFFMKSTIQTEILNNPFIYSTKGEEIASVLHTWLIYFKLLFIPHPLTHDYYPWHITIKSFSNPTVILALLITVVIIAYALLKLPKKNIVAFGILFFFITFSIQSNVLFNIGTFMNERFMFVALLGFCIIIAYFLSKYFQKFKLLKYVFLLVLILYSTKSFTRTKVWKDNYTLFTTDVKTSKNSAKVNVSAAEAIIRKAESEKNSFKAKQMYKQALTYLVKAQSIHPTYFGAYDLAGKATFHLDDFTNSVKYYKQCLTINPNAPMPLNNIYLIAQVTLAQNKIEESEHIVEWLIEFAPDSMQYHYEMALIYEKKNEFDKSLETLENVIKIDPKNVKALSKIGEIYGKYYYNSNKAEYYLLEAWKLNPNEFYINENLGIVYGMQNKFEKSLEFFNYALQIDSTISRLHGNMSKTYDLMKNPEKASYHAKKEKELEKKQTQS